MKKWIFGYIVIIAFGFFILQYRGQFSWSYWLGASALFAAGWFPFTYKLAFFQRAIKVRGEVVSCNRYVSRWGWKGYREIVAFMWEGEERTVISHSWLWDAGCRDERKKLSGLTRGVGIDPSNPKRVYACKLEFWQWLFMGIAIIGWTPCSSLGGTIGFIVAMGGFLLSMVDEGGGILTKWLFKGVR